MVETSLIRNLSPLMILPKLTNFFPTKFLSSQLKEVIKELSIALYQLNSQLRTAGRYQRMAFQFVETACKLVQYGARGPHVA